MSELSAEARRLLEAIDGVGGPTRSQRALMKRAIALAVAAPVAGAAAQVGAANGLGAAQASVAVAAQAGATAANAVGVTGQAGAAAGSSALLTAGASLAWVKLLALGIISSAVGAAATWQVLAPRAPASARPSASHATATTPASASGRAASPEPSRAEPIGNANPSAAARLAERGPDSAAPSQPSEAQLAEPGVLGATPAPLASVAVDEPGTPPIVPSAGAPAPMSDNRNVEGSVALAAPTRAKRPPTARLPEGAPPGPSRPSANAVEDAPLGRELGTVAGAMAALDAKRFTQALETVTRYRETFPTGALITEARVLEVLALCGLGRRDEAQRAASSIGANESNNPAVRRLARSCVDASQWNRLPAATQQ